MNFLESHDTPKVILTAGMDCRVTTLGMLSLLVEESRNMNLPTEFINGSFINSRGELEVSPPSQQLLELEEKVDKTKKNLIVAHCGGGAPLIDFLEAHGSDGIKGIAISLPLETPADTITLNEVQRSIVTEGDKTFLDVYDTPPDDPYNFTRRALTRLAIGETFNEEIAAVSATDFIGRAKQLATDGVLGLVAPQDDWNTAAVRMTQTWPGPILRIAGARHSLRMPSDTLDSQRQACKNALDFGLQLISSH